MAAMRDCFRIQALAFFLAYHVCTSISVTPQRHDKAPVHALVGAHVELTGATLLRSGRGLRSGQPEQLEAWQDSNKALKSQMPATELESLANAITPDTFESFLHAIVDKQDSRFIGNSGNKLAAKIIEDHLRALGVKAEARQLEPVLGMSQYGITSTSQTGGNVIGFLKGGDLAHEVVIVACHYDSVNWRDISGKAPGVDDNGSGCALMLELAKAFSHSTTRPRRSVVFAAFNAEEVGLHGSAQFSALFAQGGEGLQLYGKPVAVLVADEVAWPGNNRAGGPQLNKVIFETKGHADGTTTIVDTLAHSMKQADGVSGFVVNYHGFGSDHISFLNAGIPAVLLIERDNMYHADHWGHSHEDTFEHIDPSYGAAVTRLALRAVAALAMPTTPLV